MHKDNLEKWLESNGTIGLNEAENKKLIAELYPPDYSVDQIPSGFLVLHQLLATKFDNLFAHGKSDANDEIGQYLGSGTYSFVYGGRAKRSAIKIARPGKRPALQREIQFLKQLGSNKDDSYGRPQLPFSGGLWIHNSASRLNLNGF